MVYPTSPLGVWLLLAACASAAEEPERAELEGALGCSPAEAISLLRAFMEDPPAALCAAIAVWFRAGGSATRIREWSAALPQTVETRRLPTAEAADEWARRHTLGMIEQFPIAIDEFTQLVLASALATKVTWQEPFEVVGSAPYLQSTPWEGVVKDLLYDASPQRPSMLTTTTAAGVVAVHAAIAKDDVVVLSVSADPGFSRQSVMQAAHEVAALSTRGSSGAQQCSLYDLPPGRGHSWNIVEREIRWPPGRSAERIGPTVLPAWDAFGKLDLSLSDVFGANAALAALSKLMGDSVPGTSGTARQSVVASYGRYGFAASAVTAFGMPTALPDFGDDEEGVERVAYLYFDHPYAVVALAGAGHRSKWTGLPLFSAWVASPAEPEPDSSAPVAEVPLWIDLEDFQALES